jgi:hypothetical protein
MGCALSLQSNFPGVGLAISAMVKLVATLFGVCRSEVERLSGHVFSYMYAIWRFRQLL